MKYRGIEYRAVPGFDGYHVSKCGKIVSTRYRVGGKPFPRKAHLSHLGYYRVGLHIDSKPFRARVHRLVALAWLPPPTDGRDQINHKNGDTKDNRAENLEWVTAKENTKHLIRVLGKPRHGEHGPNHKLTDDIVKHIRSIWIPKTYGLNVKLGKMFGVRPNTIAAVAKGKSWTHVRD